MRRSEFINDLCCFKNMSNSMFIQEMGVGGDECSRRAVRSYITSCVNKRTHHSMNKRYEKKEIDLFRFHAKLRQKIQVTTNEI